MLISELQRPHRRDGCGCRERGGLGKRPSRPDARDLLCLGLARNKLRMTTTLTFKLERATMQAIWNFDSTFAHLYAVLNYKLLHFI